MALHLNLLHEEILEQRQRQRDPLKIGMLVLASCGAVLFLYYAWNAYRVIEIKARLNHITAEWKKIEPVLRQALTNLESFHPVEESVFKTSGTRVSINFR